MVLPKTGVAVWYSAPSVAFQAGHISIQIDKWIYGFYQSNSPNIQEGSLKLQSFNAFADGQMRPIIEAIGSFQRSTLLQQLIKRMKRVLRHGHRDAIPVPVAYLYPLKFTTQQKESIIRLWEEFTARRPEYSLRTFNCVHITNRILTQTGILPGDQSISRPDKYRESVLMPALVTGQAINEIEAVLVADSSGFIWKSADEISTVS